MQSLSATASPSASEALWRSKNPAQELTKVVNASTSILGPGYRPWSAPRCIKITPSHTQLKPVGSRFESLRRFAEAGDVSVAAGRRTPLRVAAATGEASAATQMLEEPQDDVCELVSGKEVELTSSVTFGAYLVEPKKNDNGAGILLLTDIMGHEEEDNRGYANRLACFGFTVLVPDFFRGQPWDDKHSEAEYESWRAKHTVENIAEDIASASSFLAEFVKEKGLEPGQGRLAVLGFCIGGGRVIETLANASTAAVFSTGVSFYGTRYDPDLASQIRVPTLLLLGDSDEKSPVKVAKEVESRMKNQGVENKLVVYEGCGHAFAHRPADMSEDQESENAFTLVKEWLHVHLL